MKTESVLDYLTINSQKEQNNCRLYLFSRSYYARIQSYSEKVNRNLSGNMIRLHIVANSDSKTPGHKIPIRDEIVNHMVKR